MTSPLQQKLKITGPSIVTANRTSDGIVIYRTATKGWSTELGVTMASLGVQVHGGMGFIEETGAAQILRDSRIAPTG